MSHTNGNELQMATAKLPLQLGLNYRLLLLHVARRAGLRLD